MPILPSHKQSITYLEHCRLVVNDEKLTLIRRKDAIEKYWSIPYANLNVMLLGPGTSLTQQAARLLASENVMVAFTGGGGTPVFLASQNEYRPTDYFQKWICIWQDPGKRLIIAKYFQQQRAKMVFKSWQALFGNDINCEPIVADYMNDVVIAPDNARLMAFEAKFAKRLYAVLAKQFNNTDFTRDTDADDDFNQFLNQGNYLAYGLGAAALWCLGIAFSLPISHGQTRRGGLVFDVGDLIKDACIMPVAFQEAAARHNTSEMRKACIAWLDKQNALDFLFKTITAAMELTC